MFLQVSVCPHWGGACMVLFWGDMRGFIWGACVVLFGGCVVLFGGRAWFYSGGMHGFIRGGMRGFIRGGTCVVLFGGHAWFYLGGACVVFSVFSDTMRYGQ